MRQSKTATARLIQRARGFRYSLVWEGIAVGAAAGLVTVLFRLLLSQGTRCARLWGSYSPGGLGCCPCGSWRCWCWPLW